MVIGKEVRRTFWNADGDQLVGCQPRHAKPLYGFGGGVCDGGYLVKHTNRPFLQKFEMLWPDLFLGCAHTYVLVGLRKSHATRIMMRGTHSYDRHVNCVKSMKIVSVCGLFYAASMYALVV